MCACPVQEAPQTGSQVMTADQAIAFWYERVKRDPQDYLSMAELARTYIRKARETGDFVNYQYAEKVLRNSLKLEPNFIAAQAYLALVHCAQHRFHEGLELAKKLYRQAPEESLILLVVGDAHLELGEYAEAERAYKELETKNPPKAPMLARQARLAELHGKTADALRFMKEALDSEKASGGTAEGVAWFQMRLGEMSLQAGKVEQAVGWFERALQSSPNYYVALVGMGKARAAQGKIDEALESLKKAAEVSPDPVVLVPLGDLYLKAGNTFLAGVAHGKLERIAQNQPAYYRELSLYYSEHNLKPKEALDLARKDLEQRADIYGHDALAWALYRNEQYPEAAKASTEALKLGTQDPMLWYHAGMIQYKLGDKPKAKELLAKAVALNPRFSILHSEEVRKTLDELK